jgi:uncharacterized protein YdhG (YjbR/CyaY superfamily)
MPPSRKAPTTIDEYIAPFPADVRAVLERVRQTIHKAAPNAEERISYKIAAFAQNGIVVWFAGFKGHIGLYPPVKGDAALNKAMARFANEKGNLRFPLDEPIPYGVIARIVKVRVKQNQAKAAGKAKSRR